ncbi:MAG: PASTA domain-containing protein [Candidatus Eisenbacteria bacterium]|uniref:PASTA domain-containing protein n=1 Tax=Eiseniibacteriota bacterium TaxID=2212470 RepID=A0A538TMA2_UNCEI|nr:MAG: PASTA domain-containing protein [Candidatus Eisenbacteria bacterium]
MSPRDLRRLRLIAVLGMGAFLFLFARLVQIQLLDHGRFARAARQQQTQRVILEPERGRIYDRHLRSLADNVSLSRLSVRPSDVKNAGATQAFLAQAAGPAAASRFRAGKARHAAYVRLSPHLTPEQELALRTTALPEGVHVEEVPSRVYPLDLVARPVVGLLGGEGLGLEGLEKMFDRDLRGGSGWATLFNDNRGITYQLPQSLVKLPEAGSSIITTIDLDAQSIAALKLREAVERTGAKSGMAVFADPRTGDILAMVTVDDPRRPGGDGHRNRLIADQYEPGSTFKILAGCAALEGRVFAPSDSFWVERGEGDFGGFTIHDSHPETRWYSVRSATALSSNVCYARIGTRLGAATLYDFARLFGFGQATRISLPGEAPGQIRHPDRWSKRSLATISIGQEVLVTPIQMLMAYAAVANGGILLRPRIVSAVVDPDGEPIREVPIEQVRRVISSETARTFRSFLRDAVTQGTATEAALPWCEVAGKTGTAQKTVENERGYGVGRYISSFIGMAPAADPVVVGLIILDEPRGAYYGGSVAAPVFREILAAWALQGRGPIALPPSTVVRVDDEAPAADAVPDVRLLELSRAREELARAGYGMRVAGMGAVGGRVSTQLPEARTAARPGTVVELTLAALEEEDAAVPDLRGLALRQALSRLSAVAIEIGRVRGSGVVVDQTPAPGEPARKGTKCSLVLSPRGT